MQIKISKNELYRMLVQSESTTHNGINYNQNYYNANGSVIVRNTATVYTEKLNISAFNAIVADIAYAITSDMVKYMQVPQSTNNCNYVISNAVHSIVELINTVYRFRNDKKINEVCTSLEYAQFMLNELSKTIMHQIENEKYINSFMMHIDSMKTQHENKNIIMRLIDSKKYNRQSKANNDALQVLQKDSAENLQRINNELKRIAQFINGTYVHQY